MTDLLPCPNPECEADGWSLAFDDGGIDCRVECYVCGMKGPQGGDEDHAARLWDALPRADRKLPTTTEGTSDRVMLAGLAMQALIEAVPDEAFDEMDSDPESDRLFTEHRQALARDAVAYADALLAELAKGNGDA